MESQVIQSRMYDDSNLVCRSPRNLTDEVG